MPGFISVWEGPVELGAAAVAMKRAPAELRKRMNQQMREELNPVWKRSLAQNMGGFSRADEMMLKGARIAAGNPPALIAASSRARYGRALKPVENWPLVEFGSNNKRESSYERRSRNGGTHRVTRRTMTGWPSRQRNGRIAGPAARETLPRLASYWIQTVVKTFMDALEEGAK